MAAQNAMSAPGSATDAQMTAVLGARRSVAELQKVLLANPMAGPPLGKVRQQPPAANIVLALSPGAASSLGGSNHIPSCVNQTMYTASFLTCFENCQAFEEGVSSTKPTQQVCFLKTLFH